MKNSFQIPLLATIFAASVCPLSGASTPEVSPEETLCIHLYNLAKIPPRTIARATARATRIFARTGIKTSWEQPAADSPEAYWLDLNTSDVKLSHSGERACLVVRLVQDVPANAYDGALGFALPLARSGVNVEIICRRIEFQAEYAGLPADLLLAYTMAHEIGHVLLGSSAHSRAGIMQAKWSAESWQLASFDMIAFLPGQAKQMRQVLARKSVSEPMGSYSARSASKESELARNAGISAAKNADNVSIKTAIEVINGLY